MQNTCTILNRSLDPLYALLLPICLVLVPIPYCMVRQTIIIIMIKQAMLQFLYPTVFWASMCLLVTFIRRNRTKHSSIKFFNSRGQLLVRCYLKLYQNCTGCPRKHCPLSFCFHLSFLGSYINSFILFHDGLSMQISKLSLI